MMPANVSCAMSSTALTAPMSRTSPYMPDMTYAMASPMVMMMPNSFWAPVKSARSSGTSCRILIILEPASSCITMLEVMMGEMPSSMRDPLQNINKTNDTQPKHNQNTTTGREKTGNKRGVR